MCSAEPVFPCPCALVAGYESAGQMGLFGVARSADSGSETGKIGAQVKTAPAVRQHCESGASPTVKESTDG